MVTNKSELRKFGLSVGGVFLVLAGITFYFDKAIYPYLAVLGGCLFIFGIVYPKSLFYIHKYWMIFAEKLSIVSTFIILTLTYFLAFLPMGIFLKLLGKDLLLIKKDTKSKTFWSDVENNKSEDRYTTPY